MGKKLHTPESLKQLAAGFQTRTAFKYTHYGAYSTALKLGILDECCAHMRRDKPGHDQIYTDDQIAEVFKRYKTRNGVKRGPDANFYALALYRYKNKPEVWKAITAHMAPPNNFGSHLMYVFKFSDNHAYVGQTSNKAKRFDTHTKTGPVAKHVAENPGVTYTAEILETGVRPVDVEAREGHWQSHYGALGWIPLHTAKPGAMGPYSTTTKTQATEAAKQCSTRNEFWTRFQAIAKYSRKMGWYDDITAHMPDIAPVSEETKAKQSAAAKARFARDGLSDEIRAKRSISLKLAWAVRKASEPEPVPVALSVPPTPPTDEELIQQVLAASRQCHSISEFARRFRQLYNLAKTLNCFAEATAHMPNMEQENRLRNMTLVNNRPVSDSTREKQSQAAKARAVRDDLPPGGGKLVVLVCGMGSLLGPFCDQLAINRGLDRIHSGNRIKNNQQVGILPRPLLPTGTPGQTTGRLLDAGYTVELVLGPTETANPRSGKALVCSFDTARRMITGEPKPLKRKSPTKTFISPTGETLVGHKGETFFSGPLVVSDAIADLVPGLGPESASAVFGS